MSPKFTYGNLVMKDLSVEKELHVTGWKMVNDYGFGNQYNQAIMYLGKFDNYLYASTLNQYDSSPSQLWRTAGADNQSDWAQVCDPGFGDSNNLWFEGMTEFNGQFYVGTHNAITGAEVWRTRIGSQQSEWEQCNTNGFGNSDYRFIQSFYIFRGFLYAVVSSYGSAVGLQIYRTKDGDTWDEVVSNGFGNIAGKGVSCSKPMIVFEDYLYISAYTPGTNTVGGLVWRSKDGVNFTQVCSNGFGTVSNRGIIQFAEYNGYLYGCSEDHILGAAVWRTQIGSQQSEWERVNDYGFGTNTFIANPAIFVYNNWLYCSSTDNTTLKTCRVWRTQVGVQQSDWEQCNVDGFGLGAYRCYEIFDFEEFNGDLYGAGMSYFNGVWYGAPVMRLRTGQVHNETGNIIAQGLTLPQISIGYGNAGDISGVNRLVANEISAIGLGVTTNIQAGTLITPPVPTQAITARSNTVLPAGSVVTLNPSADFTLTSTPTIAAGAAGQQLIIKAVANNIILQDEDQLSGSNLRLHTPVRRILDGHSLLLFHNGTEWEALSGPTEEDLGADLVANGGMGAESDWDYSSGGAVNWAVAGGVMAITNPDDWAYFSQDCGCVVGKLYKIVLTIVQNTPQLLIYLTQGFDTQILPDTSAADTYTFYYIFQTLSDYDLRFSCGPGTGTIQIDNISVREVKYY